MAKSMAYLWIISAVVVIPITLIALIRIKFKIDRVGLGVILFYNLLFILYFSTSVVVLVVDGDS
jgi:hypothetical protein